MTFRGHVENGVIVLDEPVTIADGVAVAVEVKILPSHETDKPEQSRIERYRPLIGALDNIPSDWSEKHDTYLRDRLCS